VTGLAQESGRNTLTWPERIVLDVEYVDHWSLGLDLRILWRTLGTTLRREGVFNEGVPDSISEMEGDAPGR
jgi:lipopolysaccharide/colanic/teichoic acid biosynthesis glycosyltransferase